MNEQETIKATEQTQTNANSNNGNKSEIDARIDRINIAAQRLEEAERRLQEREASLREAEAVRKLGGVTSGAPQEQAPKVETPKEYKDRILRGGI